MKRCLSLCLCMLSLSFSVMSYADDGDSSTDDVGMNAGNNYNSSSNTSSNKNNNDQLLQKMNKDTAKGLKVFDKLLKSGDDSKNEFFADVGRNPTGSQFEGDDDGMGGAATNPFAQFMGDAKK
ncbi:MAG: hypothetical protein ACO2ZM_02790 [Francisellaceae bacterium]